MALEEVSCLTSHNSKWLSWQQLPVERRTLLAHRRRAGVPDLLRACWSASSELSSQNTRKAPLKSAVLDQGTFRTMQQKTQFSQLGTSNSFNMPEPSLELGLGQFCSIFYSSSFPCLSLAIFSYSCQVGAFRSVTFHVLLEKLGFTKCFDIPGSSILDLLVGYSIESFLLQPFSIPLEGCSPVLTKIGVKGDTAIGAFHAQQLNLCPGKT